MHLNESTRRLEDTDDDIEQPSSGREMQQRRRGLEVPDNDDGSCCSGCSKHSLRSDDGIIAAQPGKELLALPIHREKSSEEEKQQPKQGEEQDSNDGDDVVLVANGCVICLEPYQSGETVVWSKNQDCIHAFHQECLIEYFQAANKGNWRLGSLFDNQSDVDNSHNDISTEFADTICPCCRQDFFLPSKKKTSSSEESTSTQGGGTATAAAAETMTAGITIDGPARPTTNNSSRRSPGGSNQSSAEDFVIHIP